MLFSKKTRKIGLHIAPKYISISEKVYKSDGSEYFNEKRFDLNGEECSVATLLDNSGVIASAAKYVAEKVGNEYADIYIALSEPYLETKILDVDKHPKRNNNFNQYLKWKLKNEYYIDSDSMYLTYEVLGGRQGVYSILVQVCDKTLVQTINDSFSTHSIPVKVIDASYNFIHNYLTSIIESKRTYFLLHLDGYWIFSSINDEMWPERIRTECFVSTSATEKEWIESLDEVYSRIARTFYLDIKSSNSREQERHVIHSIGNINSEYGYGWDNYFPMDRKPVGEFLNAADCSDYFTANGYLAIERLAALCQR